ncbi:MAG TPA: hypothetical protein VGO93_02060 [Candidatus Xenobia bacterium]|jgi:hypothetical protein
MTEIRAAGRFARGLILAVALGSGGALFAQQQTEPPVPIDVVTLNPSLPSLPQSQPAPPTLAKNPLNALPTTLFKMGNSAYTGHAPLGYNIGTPKVTRTPDTFTLDTKIGPITIKPDTTNPDIVDIVTNKATYQGTLKPTPDGAGAVAQTLNKKKTITFHPGQSAGQVDIDMKGYVPLMTLHVTLLPIS